MPKTIRGGQQVAMGAFEKGQDDGLADGLWTDILDTDLQRILLESVPQDEWRYGFLFPA